MTTSWVIRKKETTDRYWSGFTESWTDWTSSSTYDNHHKGITHLPPNGEWVAYEEEWVTYADEMKRGKQDKHPDEPATKWVLKKQVGAAGWSYWSASEWMWVGESKATHFTDEQRKTITEMGCTSNGTIWEDVLPEKPKATLEEQINAIGGQLAQTITTYGSRLDEVGRRVHSLERRSVAHENEVEKLVASVAKFDKRLNEWLDGHGKDLDDSKKLFGEASKLHKDMSALFEDVAELRESIGDLRNKDGLNMAQFKILTVQMGKVIDELRGRKPAKRPAKKGAKR